tara:strand:- start:35 stop:271 length:237 start_codon:yes stop_codon:yes gene_type:complete
MVGSINKVIVDDKGALVLCVFGLPPMVHHDDSYRAITAAFLMRHHLHDLGLFCKIGVATNRGAKKGPTFCVLAFFLPF